MTAPWSIKLTSRRSAKKLAYKVSRGCESFFVIATRLATRINVQCCTCDKPTHCNHATAVKRFLGIL